MAWVTTLGPNMAQVEYRLTGSAGCSLDGHHDPAGGAGGGVTDDGQVAYRLDNELPLEWIGDGLRDVGIEPGTAMTEDQKVWARAIMDGRHPLTGEQLVQPKLAVDPRAKLAARPLLDSIEAAALFREITVPALLAGDALAGEAYVRAARGVARNGERHRVAIGHLERLSEVTGIDLGVVYDAAELATAREFADERVVVGNRGYDLTLDLTKTASALYGLVDEQTARELEGVYRAAVRDTVTAMQGWAAYGMRGHHGDGQRAERVESTGLLGWSMVHRTARPVDGAAPDPHWHAHISLANLVHGVDGKWSTVGAGGRDIHRHAHAADAYLKARIRAETSARWGIRWERDPHTGAWEIAEVPDAIRGQLSKRHNQVAATLQQMGLDVDTASAAQAKDAAARSREAKQQPGPGGDLRAEWQEQARTVGVDPAEMAAAAMPGPQPAAADARPPTPEEIAAWIFRDGQLTESTARRVFTFNEDGGLTVHRKVVSRADILAAVIDAMPGGLADLDAAEQLVDEVLQVPGYAVRLPAAGAVHLTNSARYTSADVVEAERAVLDAARAGYGAGIGVVDPVTADLAIEEFELSSRFVLSAEQRTMLDRLLLAGHGVDAVIGVAGSGKTTIMSVVNFC